MNSNATPVDTSFTIKAFAAARELIGGAVIVFLPAGASVGDLRAELLRSFPKLAGLKEFAIARNENYALPGELLEAGDELVIIPPVSGG